MALIKGKNNARGLLDFNKKSQPVRDQDRVISKDTPFFVRESYKALRTNLNFSLPADKKKIILVTSAGASEGKTTNCLNTAITFAETGAKVCVVDCDLRKPNIARLNMEKGTPGLSNVLVKLNKLEDVIRKSKYENLEFVYSGDIPPNPAELLESKEMENVLNRLSEMYDYVFVDTPPVNVVTDASLIARLAGGVLLVVNQHKTTRSELGKAIAQLEFVQAKILGILFNGVKSEKKGRGYKYGNGYYAYKSYTVNGEEL